MTRLPDPKKSRALLLGFASYSDPSLPGLPSVKGNLSGLNEVLTDPEETGLPPEHCITVSETDDVQGLIGSKLHDLAAQADDMLLVYYAGHGLIGPNGELFLALPQTQNHPDLVAWTSLRFQLVRSAVASARAHNRIIILDCCFSGRALGTMAGVASAVSGQLEASGTCTLASSPANSPSSAPLDKQYTAYTGELLDLLRNGSPSQPELLTLTSIHEHLAWALPARGLPRPVQHNTETISQLALAPNRRWTPPTAIPPTFSLDPETTVPGPAWSRRRFLFTAAGASAAAIGAGTGIWIASSPAPRPTLRGTIGGPNAIGLNGTVGAMAFSSDGRMLAAGDSGDSSNHPGVWVFDVTDPSQPASNYPGQKYADTDPLFNTGSTIGSVTFSPDGHSLAAACSDGTTWLANVNTYPDNPIKLKTPTLSGVPVGSSMSFSPDGYILAGGTSENNIWLWNVRNPANPVQFGTPLSGSTSATTSAVFSPAGSTLAVSIDNASCSRTVAAAHPANSRVLNAQLADAVLAHYGYAAFSPRNHVLATSDGGMIGSNFDGNIWLWNVTDQLKPAKFRTSITGTTMVFSPDGRTLAVGMNSGNVLLWNVADPAHPARLSTPKSISSRGSAPSAMTFSADSHILAVGPGDNSVLLWDVTDPTRPTKLAGTPLTGPDNSVTSVAFSPKGRTLAIGSDDGVIQLWNVPQS